MVAILPTGRICDGPISKNVCLVILYHCAEFQICIAKCTIRAPTTPAEAKPMLFIILLYTMFHLTLSHELLYICTVEFATAGIACPVCCSDFSCIFQSTENNVPWMWCLGKLYGQSKQFSLFVSDSLDPAFVISPYDSSVQVASFCALLWTLILLKRLSE